MKRFLCFAMAASRLRQPGYSGVSPHFGGGGGGGGGGAYASAGSPTYGSPYMAYAPQQLPMMVPAGMAMGGGSPVMMMGGGGAVPVVMGGGSFGGYGGGGYGSGGGGGYGGGAEHLGERGSMLDLMSGAWRCCCDTQPVERASASFRCPARYLPRLTHTHTHTHVAPLSLCSLRQMATSCSTRGTWRPRTSGSSGSARCASAWPTRPRRPCTRRR